MRHDEAEDMGFGMRKERSEPVMVNMSPPATQRDRWMYEQGRLAERDPRTHSEVAWDLAEKVRRDLDRQSCPGVYMNLAMESIVKHYTTPPAAQPATEESSEVQHAAQPSFVQEPVAWMHKDKIVWVIDETWSDGRLAKFCTSEKGWAPLYTAPPAAKPAVPLTGEQIQHLVDTHVGEPNARYPLDRSDWMHFARAIEAAHGIKDQP